jgi:cephalosporin hydroxylase
MTRSLDEAAFRTSVYALLEDVERRRTSVQHEIPTAFDKSMWQLAVLLARFDAATPWEQSCTTIPDPEGAHVREALAVLKGIVARRKAGRYVAYGDRLADGGCDMTPTMLAMASGVGRSLMWKDLPLFKTAFDLAIYSMLLWELKPTLIVEIGSGTGTSAIWLADLLRMFRIEGKVVTFDCQALDLTYDGVDYVQGDCRTIARDFDARIVAANAGPTLLVEDAHVNVAGVLDHFHPVLKKGDYVIVEDSLAKRDVLTHWTDRHPDVYRVDSRFVDFFGHNVTSAQDSIFVRMH